MFDNAGQKLKGLAKFIFGFIVVVSCLLAIIGMKSAGGVTLLLIPAGIVVGWLSSILLYAFGELCENVNNIAYYNGTAKKTVSPSQPVSHNYNNTAPKTPIKKSLSDNTSYWICPECDEKNSSQARFCRSCGCQR